MEVILADNQALWDNWLKKAVFCPFQQFWGWGEVLELEGKRVERLIIKEGTEIVAQAQVVYTALPFGWRYAYCAGGPVESKNEELRIKNQAYELLGTYLKDKGCIFFRVEPAFFILNSSFLIQKSIDLNPATTTVLDLSKTTDELFEGMEKKTRYAIRKAQDKGVVVKQVKNFDIFWKLLQETGKRNSFNLHSKKHYEIIFTQSECVQLTAYKESTPVATALFWGAGDTFTYLFAASDYAFHDLQAPYLIQKEAIELAKSRGFKKYDFYGVAPMMKATDNSKQTTGSEYEYDRTHQYAGITKFKMGFGGEVVAKPGTFDLLLKPTSYLLYSLLRRVRRLF